MSKHEEYLKLCHAMQTGVAAAMNIQGLDGSTQPKHLRVGVNSALVCASALARLLMNKGIITEDEYYDSLIEVMREEVKKYEREIWQATGTKVSLG